MSDLISRQDAIGIIDKVTESHNSLESIKICAEARSGLLDLLSAEPKTGKWIKATGMMPPEFHGHHCCSECGAFANMDAPFGNREDLSDYCPNCGADMRGKNDEDETEVL